MSRTARRWSDLYRDAILESDPDRLHARIDEASSAIQSRSRELWYAGSTETRERRDLDSALHFLKLLKVVGVAEESRQPQR